jgi:GNAT superfamily N-acetyltransferase
MELTYKKAEMSQLDDLVKLRIKVLRAANKLSYDVDMSKIEQHSYVYYKQGFQSNNFTVYLAYDGDQIVGCGGVSYFDIMPTFDFPNGKCAYIMNMYTESEYRKKGISTRILDLLVKDSKEKDIHKITLEATDMGRSVYDKYGFIQMKNEMELI